MSDKDKKDPNPRLHSHRRRAEALRQGGGLELAATTQGAVEPAGHAIAVEQLDHEVNLCNAGCVIEPPCSLRRFDDSLAMRTCVTSRVFVAVQPKRSR